MKTLWNGGMEDFTKVLPESEIVKEANARIIKLLEETRDTAYRQGYDAGYLRGRLEGQSFLT